MNKLTNGRAGENEAPVPVDEYYTPGMMKSYANNAACLVPVHPCGIPQGGP
jgi:hypothetical protein